MNEINKDAWREAKEAERKQLNELQKSAIAKVVSSGEELAKYLEGRGRLGSRFSSGNAALILAQNPSARAVKSLDEWSRHGRRVGRGERGIKIIGRENGYWRVQHVFELSQTFGPRPYMLPRIAGAPDKVHSALAALEGYSPARFDYAEQSDPTAKFEPHTQKILFQREAPEEELFAPLVAAVVIAHAYFATKSGETSPVKELYAKCAAVELCGRFGLEVSETTVQEINTLLPSLALPERKKMLDEIGQFARTLGRDIEDEVFDPEYGCRRIRLAPPDVIER